MHHMFATSFAGQAKPPALLMRRFRRRQQALFGKPRSRLFLAVVPDAVTSARIAETARRLRISHNLVGKPVRAEHFHINLYGLDGGIDASIAGIELVKERVSQVVMPAFRVGFDRAQSFKNGALVLRSEAEVIGLEILQQRLCDALDGRPGKARPFTPYVTLLHDGYRVPEQRVEPIEWTVRELVLVHTVIGRMMHRHLTRWSLGDASDSDAMQIGRCR